MSFYKASRGLVTTPAKTESAGRALVISPLAEGADDWWYQPSPELWVKSQELHARTELLLDKQTKLGKQLSSDLQECMETKKELIGLVEKANGTASQYQALYAATRHPPPARVEPSLDTQVGAGRPGWRTDVSLRKPHKFY